MATQLPTVLILGEGLTEFYYFQSLKDQFKRLNIKPDNPKHTNLQELGDKIEEGIDKGYDYIFCVIDMDNKDNESERLKYAELKKKYKKPIRRKNNTCEVLFFETHRCTELFFLYYFKYTSRQYDSQNKLLEDLKDSVPYDKKEKFFLRCKGLHSYLTRNGGMLDKAVCNSLKSMDERMKTGRNYTYSELGNLIKKLYELGM